MVQKPFVVLASASEARAKLLKNAGIPFEIRSVRVDEESVRDSLSAEQATGREIAEALAELKALRGITHGDELLIAADQVLIFKEEVLGKAKNTEEARRRLSTLSGEEHQLATAACVAKNGSIIWRHVDTARLWMRSLSNSFLDLYVERNKDAILKTVGGYEIEGEGAQLFRRMEGDHFTILGLPLLPLLDVLREHGVIKK